MDAALTLGDRHALNAVDTRFPAHDSKRSFSLHLEDRFLHSAERSIRLRDDLDAPAPAFRESCVHAVEIGGKDRGLIAPGAATYLHNRRTVVQRVVRYQRRLVLLEGSEEHTSELQSR